jgi:uncharacterized protein
MSALREVEGRVRVIVKAKPRASREGLSEKDDVLVVSVNAAPVDGEATARVLEVLADALGVRRSSLRVVRGETSRHKEIEADGLTLAEAQDRLNRALGR